MRSTRAAKRQAGCARPLPKWGKKRLLSQSDKENIPVLKAPMKKKVKRTIQGFVPKALFQDTENGPLTKAVKDILNSDKQLGSDDIWPATDIDNQQMTNHKTTEKPSLTEIKTEPRSQIKRENPEYVEPMDQSPEQENKKGGSFTESEVEDMLRSSPEENIKMPDKKPIIKLFDEKILEADIVGRLSEARHLQVMTNLPGYWKTVTLDSHLPNAYAKAANVVVWRLIGALPASLEQIKVLKNNYGHLVASVMAAHNKLDMKQAILTLGRIPEIERYSNPNICAKCGLHHFLQEKTCPVRLDNQPMVGSARIIHLAKWRNQVKVFVIGFEALIALPADTMGKIYNLGRLGRPDYTVSEDTTYMTRSWAENQDLFKTILRQLKLVGLDCAIPVLIEFTTSHSKSTFSSVWNHVVSHCTIIKYLQSMYCGPLIVVMPPTHFFSGQTTEEYAEKKMLSQQMSQCLNLAGQAIGVGTGTIWVNSMTVPEGEIRNLSMRPYPLYNLLGAESAEYSRRLTTQILRIAESVRDIMVGGNRRRRGLTSDELAELDREDTRIKRLSTW